MHFVSFSLELRVRAWLTTISWFMWFQRENYLFLGFDQHCSSTDWNWNIWLDQPQTGTENNHNFLDLCSLTHWRLAHTSCLLVSGSVPLFRWKHWAELCRFDSILTPWLPPCFVLTILNRRFELSGLINHRMELRSTKISWISAVLQN